MPERLSRAEALAKELMGGSWYPTGVKALEQAFAAVAAEARAGGVREAAKVCDRNERTLMRQAKKIQSYDVVRARAAVSEAVGCGDCAEDILALLDPEPGRGEGK